MRRRRLGFTGLVDAFTEDPHRRFDLPLLTLARDDSEHLKYILHRFEMIAAIAQDVNDADDAPVLEFPQTGAGVGPGNTKRLGNLIGGQRFFGEEEQRVDLRDGPVETPTGAHFSPMEDKLLRDWSQVCHSYQSFLSKQK